MATVRLTVVCDRKEWTEAPALRVFGDERAIGPMARAGFVEASRLCFAQQARRDAFLRLVSYMAAMASFHETGWLVACPRVEHAESYQRMFGFEAIAPPRPYFGVTFRTQLLAISRKELLKYVSGDRLMKSAWSNALDHLTQSTRTLSRAAANF
jgi:hypothetical protein